MSAPGTTYTVISTVHQNQWDDQQQKVIPGVKVNVRSEATKAIIPVFIPNTQYTPGQVGPLLAQAVANSDAINQLTG